MTDRLIQIVFYAIAVGISIRVFALAWRYFWNIEIGLREGGVLAGGTMALLVVWGIERGPLVATLIAAIVIVGYFIGKVVQKYIAGQKGV